MAKTKKSSRNGRKLHGKTHDPVLVATILAYAAKETVVAACERFKVADRSVRRYKAKVEAGQWPEVAKLLEEMKREAAERCGDLLTEAYEVSLRRIIDLGKTLSPEQAIRAAEVFGQLKITKDVLSDPASGDSPGGGTS